MKNINFSDFKKIQKDKKDMEDKKDTEDKNDMEDISEEPQIEKKCIQENNLPPPLKRGDLESMIDKLGFQGAMDELNKKIFLYSSTQPIIDNI